MKQGAPELQQEKLMTKSHGRSAKTGLIISIIVNVVLLVLIGWLWWQLQIATDKEATFDKGKAQLQSQIDDLKKQVDAKSTATTNTPACSGTVTQAIKDNIKDAINSDNTAALEGYMASSLKVMIAASEFNKTRTPAEAIADLNYIHDSSGWNFALSTATVTSYLAGPYGTGIPGANYFTPTTYFGKASDDKVVAFNFDSCAKINQVFMAASADLLL